MKFSHMSDCHLGGWRDPLLRETSMHCFNQALDTSINDKADFILISGDLFDTSRPAIDIMERAVSKLKEAKDAGIEIYVIEGSHDFSPTGKTMLRVLVQQTQTFNSPLRVNCLLQRCTQERFSESQALRQHA